MDAVVTLDIVVAAILGASILLVYGLIKHDETLANREFESHWQSVDAMLEGKETDES
jgi:hypothetical protein